MRSARIDRLSLRIPGHDEQHARRLARLVAERLAATGYDGASGRIDAIRLRVRVGEEHNMDAMADQIVNGLLREIQRQT